MAPIYVQFIVVKEIHGALVTADHKLFIKAWITKLGADMINVTILMYSFKSMNNVYFKNSPYTMYNPWAYAY